MAETVDVAIAGAGFAEATTAYHLTRHRAGRVAILEAEDRPDNSKTRSPGRYERGWRLALVPPKPLR